jgi:probable rRNA maturation factor
MEEPPSYHSIVVLNQSELVFDPRIVEAGVYACLELEAAFPSDIRVLIAHDEEVRRLNSKFRGVDEATDVLTFPDEGGSSGDIAIAGEFARRQANLRGVPLQDELVLLAIHGTLHLIGLEDESEGGRLLMIERMYLAAERIGIRSNEDWGSLLHDLEPRFGASA